MSGSRKLHDRLPAHPEGERPERLLRLTPPTDSAAVPGEPPAADPSEASIAPVSAPVSAPIVVADPPVAAPAAPRAAAQPRRRALPVDRRPWRVLVVPPTAGAPTRTFDVARWQARLALAVVSAGAVVVIASLLALFTAVRDPGFLGGSDERSLLRDRVAILEDSLDLAASAIAELSEAVGGAGAAGERRADGTPASAPADRSRGRSLAIGALARRRPFAGSARTERAPAADAGGDASMSTGTVPPGGLPVAGAVASGFSTARRHPLLRIVRPHLGVDVRAPTGTRISAPAAGRVTFVGRKFAYGLVVEIQHADGVVTRYAHCRTALVREGADVARGAQIATVGSSGITTGPHLHYEVLVNGRQVDPMKYRLPGVGGTATTSPAAPASSAAAPVPAVPLPGAPDADTPQVGSQAEPQGSPAAPPSPEQPPASAP